MTTDNKQSVLTDARIRTLIMSVTDVCFRTPTEDIELGRTIEKAVLSKLRGAGEPVAWMAEDGRTVNSATREGMHAITKASFCIPLYAAPQASAEVRNTALEEAAQLCESECSHRNSDAPNAIRRALAHRIRVLKSAPAAESPAKGSGDVSEYRDSEHFHKEASVAELGACQRGWDECREFDRQQRGGDVGARHPAVVKWRNDGIEACAGIADAYGMAQAAIDIRAMLTKGADDESLTELDGKQPVGASGSCVVDSGLCSSSVSGVALLENSLREMIEVAERVDGWQSFPIEPIERARAALAANKADDALGRLVAEKFTSGNAIPVERITITRAEYDAIAQQGKEG